MKKYKVVIVGAGNIGALFDQADSEEILTHAHAFSADSRFVLKGFFDADFERAKVAAERWRVTAFQTLDEAMEGTDIVCCTVPDKFHFDVLKQIAEYPIKLVFTEKPFTKTIAQSEEIVKLYQEKQIPILLNYTRRFVTELIQLKEKIGEYGSFLRGTGYYGKGILHNGSHMIDFIRYLLGEVSVEKSQNPIFDFEQDDPSVEAYLTVAGSPIFLHPVDCQVATIFELELFFEKARIRLLDGCAYVERFEVLPSPTYEGYFNYRKVDEYPVKYDSSFRNAVSNIADYLEKKTALICTEQDGLRVLEICKRLQLCK